MGFDSLFLTQANSEFRKKFKVKITFRQLLQEAPTLDALAQFIDNNLPPEAFPEKSSHLAVVPRPPMLSSTRQHADGAHSRAPGAEFAEATAQLTEAAAQPTASASTRTLERIIQQQLQVMSQQLALLRDGDTRQSNAIATDRTHQSISSGTGGIEGCSAAEQTRRAGCSGYTGRTAI